MEKANKRKAKAVAIAAAAVLALAGTIAYLADASGTIRNVFDNEHIRVQINESGITDSTTGANTDNGDKDYTVLPGTSEGKDPTITVDTDTDAYVFAVVKDTINSHTKQGASQATKFVDYHIADGWTLLDEGGESSEFGPKTIKKYVDILNEKTTGDLAVNPKDPNTKIYYRIVHGNELADTNHDVEGHRFTFNLLTNDQISYPTTLTNEDMELLSGITTDENKALIFQTWAIQMEPFCPADEVATADPTADDQKQYAKDAWNQTEPVVNVTGVTVTPETLSMKVGDADQQLTATVAPENATNKNVTWKSSDDTVATVDANGNVHAVAPGTATITATSVDNPSISDSITVTVTPKEVAVGHIKLAMQLHSASASSVEFWPAMGTHEYGSKCNGAHCIHNDSWEEIKAHPENYTQCITAGCTKTVTIDETSNSTIFNGIYGNEAGMLDYKELNSEACMWSSTGDNSNPTYGATLDAIKAGSDIPSGATMKLLSMADLGNPAMYTPDSSRVIYSSVGTTYRWWLADPYHGSDIDAYFVHNDGYVDCDNVVDSDNHGIAPAFSY